MAANSKMGVFQIFYVSRACEGFDISDLRDILAASRRNNQFDDLTGCMLFSGRHFAQVLEGAVASIGDLLMTIAADRRHTGMRVLVNHTIPERQYPQWSMECLHNPDVDLLMAHLLKQHKPVLPSKDLLTLMAGVRVEALVGTR